MEVVTYTWVSLKTLSTDIRDKFGIPATVQGLLVEKSTGEEKTFKKGVVIVEINGAKVKTTQDVNSLLKKGVNRFYVWYRGKYYFHAYRIP